MQDLIDSVTASGGVNGARLADWLWMQAGRPSGRYMEFWLGVEDAIEKLRRSTNASRKSPRQRMLLKQASAAVHSKEPNLGTKD
jgi:hypothetical protein